MDITVIRIMRAVLDVASDLGSLSVTKDSLLGVVITLYLFVRLPNVQASIMQCHN